MEFSPDRYPNSAEVIRTARWDAAIYSRDYKSKIWLVLNYKGGFFHSHRSWISCDPRPKLRNQVAWECVDLGCAKTRILLFTYTR